MAFIANTNQAFAYGVPTLYGRGSGNDSLIQSTGSGTDAESAGTPVFTGNTTCKEVRIATDHGLIGVLERQASSNTANVHVIQTDGTSVTNFRVPTNSQSVIAVYDHTFGMTQGRMVIGDPGYNSQNGRALVYDYDGNLLHTLTLQTTAQYGAAQYGTNVAIGCGRIVVGSALWSTGSEFPGLYEVWDYDGNYINNLQPPFSSVTNLNYAYGSTLSKVAIGCGKIVFQASSDGAKINNIVRVCDLNLNPLYDLDNIFNDMGLSGIPGYTVTDGLAVGCGLIAVVDSNRVAMYDIDTGGYFLGKMNLGATGIPLRFPDLRFGRLAVGQPTADVNSLDDGMVYVVDLDAEGTSAITGQRTHKQFKVVPTTQDAELGNGVAIGHDYVVMASNDNDTTGAPAKVYVQEISTGITPYDILEQQSYGY